jgi:hypothetical protein
MPLPRRATLLATGRELVCREEGGDLLIDLPADGRDPVHDVVALEWQEEPATGLLPVQAGQAKPGLRCEVFTGKRFVKLADFAGGKAVRDEIVPTVSLAPGGEAEQFALRFTGLFQAPVAGEYVFHLSSDDGASLAVGGTELINLDGLHGPVARLGRVQLKAGLHALELLYFQAGGGKELAVEFEGPAFPRQPLPPENLWHEN